MTFLWLSRTGRDVMDSLYIISKAVAKGLSPLFWLAPRRRTRNTHLMA